MDKKLNEMTLEELWQLFPIRLTEHNGRWLEYYAEMENSLKQKLRAFDGIIISHIGSTAVAGIWAKPIIDILLEIPEDTDMKNVAENITAVGFLKMSEQPARMSFNYGYTENGFAEKVYHLHLRYAGDNAELYFRDYLIDNPDVAQEYQKLKIELWHKFEHDRDAYTDAKTEFINRITRKAKSLYGDRYKRKQSIANL